MFTSSTVYHLSPLLFCSSFLTHTCTLQLHHIALFTFSLCQFYLSNSFFLPRTIFKNVQWVTDDSTFWPFFSGFQSKGACLWSPLRPLLCLAGEPPSQVSRVPSGSLWVRITSFARVRTYSEGFVVLKQLQKYDGWHLRLFWFVFKVNHFATLPLASVWEGSNCWTRRRTFLILS